MRERFGGRGMEEIGWNNSFSGNSGTGVQTWQQIKRGHIVNARTCLENKKTTLLAVEDDQVVRVNVIM